MEGVGVRLFFVSLLPGVRLGVRVSGLGKFKVSTLTLAQGKVQGCSLGLRVWDVGLRAKG